MIRLCISLLLSFSLTLAPIRAKEDSALVLEKYLAVHSFLAVDRAWKTKIAFMDRVEDSFVSTTPKPVDFKAAEHFKEIRYFTGSQDEQPVKITVNDCKGHSYSELDQLTDGKLVVEQFSRGFYPNGDLRCFQHWRAGRIVNAVSINPNGKIEEVKEGNGRLTIHEPGGEYRRTWLHNGLPLALEFFKNNAAYKLILYGNDNAILTLQRNVENLILPASGETWIRSGNGEIGFQPLHSFDEKGQVAQQKNQSADVLLMPARIDSRNEGLVQDVQKNWANVYPLRRRNFFNYFNTILSSARLTLQDIDLPTFTVHKIE